jgi:hypothetical protein
MSLACRNVRSIAGREPKTVVHADREVGHSIAPADWLELRDCRGRRVGRPGQRPGAEMFCSGVRTVSSHCAAFGTSGSMMSA